MLTIAQLYEKAALMRQCPTLSEGRTNGSFATMGLSFESQVVFGCYILDFVVLSRLLVVEVDGESHASKQAYDAQRDAFYAELGLQVLRIPNAWAHTAALLVEPFPEIPNYTKRWAKALRKVTHRQAVVENLKLLTSLSEKQPTALPPAQREGRRQLLTTVVQGLPEGYSAKESPRAIAQTGLTPKLKQRKKTPENREAHIAAGIEKMLAKKASRKAKLEVRLSGKLGNELSA